MKSQIFKKLYPLELFIKFLEDITCNDDNEEYYYISKIVYRQSIYFNKLYNFLDSLKDYYFAGKMYYLERKMNYKNFATIIRQLAKLHNIKVVSKIIYNNSNYEISYYIYK